MTPDDPDWDNDTIIEEYIGAFSARQDLFVKNGAAVFRQPLDAGVVRHAIEHHYPVSGYLGTTDDRTQVGAIDFDTTDGLTSGQQVQAFLNEQDIPSLLAESRDGRAHLWITSWDWLPTGEMRRMLRAAVALVLGDGAVEDTKVERFPKPGEDLAVGALRLPGLAHHRDQQVYPIRTVIGDIPSTFRAILERHVLTTPEAIKRLAGQAPRQPTPYPKNLGVYAQPSRHDYGPEPSATEVLSEWGVQIKPGSTGRCPKHDDKHGSLTVFRDDHRVYCGAPHCPLNNGGHGVGSVQLSRMTGPA